MTTAWRERGWVWLTLLALAAAPALAGSVFSAEGSFERTLTVTGPVALDVTTGSGNIQIRTGESGRVRVVGRIRATRGFLGGSRGAEEKVRYLEANPPIEQSGNSIRIGTIEQEELRRNISISYEIEVPADTRVKAHTGSGNQTIEGVKGPVEAGTGSGELRITGIGGEVRASTGSGDIELDSVEGMVRAETGSGSIRALGVGGIFIAETGSGNVVGELTKGGDAEVGTGSGNIEVRGVRGGVRASTGSGNIRIEGEPTNIWKLEAGSGGIALRLPANAGFELNARTGSGSISSDHPITVQGTFGRRQLRGTVRGGGPLIDLHTASGNIRIE